MIENKIKHGNDDAFHAGKNHAHANVENVARDKLVLV